MGLINRVKKGTILKTTSVNFQSYNSEVKFLGEEDRGIKIEIIKPRQRSGLEKGDILYCFNENFNENNYKILSIGNIRKIT